MEIAKKDFKAAGIIIFKELKETMFKELKYDNNYSNKESE